MTGACEKPMAKGAPKPIYISVEKGGKITFSDNVPRELQVEIRKAADSGKVSPELQAELRKAAQVSK